jgi:hypothetical protein
MTGLDSKGVSLDKISGLHSNNNNNEEDQEDAEEEVIRIDLSRISSSNSSSIKLSSTGGGVSDASDYKSVDSGPHDSDTLEIIIRPTKQGLAGFGSSAQLAAPGKPLWRKREVIKQEKTVHYTTVDEDGSLQELVEKETTQTEILHMECRETGEFAHRELTQYEQVEMFNDEVVNTVRGNEEYVHLKSLEDEFHYMDSNMPPKERDEKESNEEEARRAGDCEQGEGQGGGEGEGEERRPRYYYDPNEVPPDCDPNNPHDGGSYQGDNDRENEGDMPETPYRKHRFDPDELGKEPVGAKDKSYLFEPGSPDNIGPGFFANDNINTSPNMDNISPVTDIFDQDRVGVCIHYVLLD